MPIDQLETLKARLHALKSTLESASEKQKSQLASTALAQNFNTIVTEVKAAFPDLASALPAPVREGGAFSHMGASSVHYLDLEVFAEQVLSLLALVRR